MEKEKKYDKVYSNIATQMVEGKYEVPGSIAPLVRYYKDLMNTEKQLVSGINSWVSGHPIYKTYLKHVAGIGPVLSANLIAMIEPVERFEKPSKLVAYAGYSGQHYEQECEEGHKFMSTSPKPNCPVKFATDEGVMEICEAPIIKSVLVKEVMKRKKGYVMFTNTHMKTLMFKIGNSIEHLSPEKSIYRKMYDEAKARYNSMEGITKGHARMMALRYTEKRFLINLHVAWMQGRGFEVTPYEATLQNHTIEPIILDDKAPLPAFNSLPPTDTSMLWAIKQLTGSYYDVQVLRLKAYNNIVAYVYTNKDDFIKPE